MEDAIMRSHDDLFNLPFNLTLGERVYELDSPLRGERRISWGETRARAEEMGFNSGPEDHAHFLAHKEEIDLILLNHSLVFAGHVTAEEAEILARKRYLADLPDPAPPRRPRLSYRFRWWLEVKVRWWLRDIFGQSRSHKKDDAADLAHLDQVVLVPPRRRMAALACNVSRGRWLDLYFWEDSSADWSVLLVKRVQ